MPRRYPPGRKCQHCGLDLTIRQWKYCGCRCANAAKLPEVHARAMMNRRPKPKPKPPRIARNLPKAYRDETRAFYRRHPNASNTTGAPGLQRPYTRPPNWVYLPRSYEVGA